MAAESLPSNPVSIEQRLRAAHPYSAQYANGSNLLLEAAAEIERLQRELAISAPLSAVVERDRLREMLEQLEMTCLIEHGGKHHEGECPICNALKRCDAMRTAHETFGSPEEYAADRRVFVSTDFAGHWPVGSAAVMIATDEAEALRYLSNALDNLGLKIGDATVRELITFGCEVLCDGNY